MSSTDTEGRTSPAEGAPLTQQEYQLVQRLFSDPFSFPVTFKTWLVSFLETSDMNLPISAVNGLVSILGITGVGSGTLGILPAGMIFPFGGSTAPTGSLMCDGASYLRASYDRLFKVIGTTYGAVDANSFSVPDLRERVPVGRGAMAEHDTLGKTENLPVGQRGTKHGTSLVNLDANLDGSTSSPGPDGRIVVTDHGVNGVVTQSTIHAPGGRPADTPAFITLNFIIVA